MAPEAERPSGAGDVPGVPREREAVGRTVQFPSPGTTRKYNPPEL